MKYIPVVTVAAAALLLISRWLPGAQSVAVGEDRGLILIRVVLSAIVLGAAPYTVLSKKYGSATERWAFGAIGTVLGYWLA